MACLSAPVLLDALQLIAEGCLSGPEAVERAAVVEAWTNAAAELGLKDELPVARGGGTRSAS